MKCLSWLALPHSSSPPKRSLKILTDIICLLFLLPLLASKQRFVLPIPCSGWRDCWYEEFLSLPEAPWCFPNYGLHSGAPWNSPAPPGEGSRTQEQMFSTSLCSIIRERESQQTIHRCLTQYSLSLFLLGNRLDFIFAQNLNIQWPCCMKNPFQRLSAVLWGLKYYIYCGNTSVC